MEDMTVYRMDDDPWNRKRHDGPPGIDEIFKDLFGDGGSSRKSGPSKPIPLMPIIFGLLLLFVASGIFIVGPAEKGVVVRLGKIHRIAEPGPSWAFPLLEARKIVDVERIGSYNYKAEMLTSDESYADVDVTVFYRVKNPVDFLYNAVNPVDTLGQVTASALRQVVGNTTLDDILTDGRAEARDKIQAQIESVVDYYKLGIEVTDTKLQNANFPSAVKPAFDDVIQAREDYDRFIMNAEAYRNTVVPRAEGQKMQILSAANAERAQIVNHAYAEVAPFQAILPEYRKHPDIIRNELFVSTMREVYQRSNKVFVSSEGNLNMLPLGELLSSKENRNEQ